MNPGNCLFSHAVYRVSQTTLLRLAIILSSTCINQFNGFLCYHRKCLCVHYLCMLRKWGHQMYNTSDMCAISNGFDSGLIYCSTSQGQNDFGLNRGTNRNRHTQTVAVMTNSCRTLQTRPI